MQIAIWNVTINDSGMTIVDVIVEGLISGLDSGGVIQRFYICCQANENLKVYSDAAVVRCTNNGSSPPAGILTIAVGQNGYVVQFAVKYTPQVTSASGSALHTTINARGGSHKIQRVSGGVYA